MSVTLNTGALKTRESTSDPWSQSIVQATTDLAPVLEITGNGQLSGFTATDLTGAANELKTDVGNLRGGLAYVENGNTASRNYTAGQYVCWKGILYTVNSGGISSGATLSVGTGSNQLTAVGDKGGLNDLRDSITTYIGEVVKTVELDVTTTGVHTVTVSNCSVPSKDGWTFVGWICTVGTTRVPLAMASATDNPALYYYVTFTGTTTNVYLRPMYVKN